MAMYMALFLPYLVSGPSYTALNVPLAHIRQYTILFTTKFGKYATCDTFVYLHFFCSAGLMETAGG